ncbi:MAG: ABC transporter permease [Oscillospiraceae bacterium]
MSDFYQAVRLLFGSDSELRVIIAVTLQMSLMSTCISSLIGLPLGILLGSCEFKCKRLISRINSTLMSLPPVVAGLVVFMLLSRSGPLGSLKLLYTVSAMITAQVLLITPIITGMTAAVISSRSGEIVETSIGLNLKKSRILGCMLYESRTQLIAVVLSGFGRAIAEVGAVQLVGGNVQYKTRVMTTAIMLETNMGHFSFALALGAVLLIISFIVNTAARSLENAVDRRSGRKRFD